MSAVATHHADCDGWRSEHVIEWQRTEGGVRAVCSDCGPLHVGTFGRDAESDARQQYGGHGHTVPCDGRCLQWK